MDYLGIKFTKEKEYLNKCVNQFNELCDQGLYPEILEFTQVELYRYANNTEISVAMWKEFLLEPKIQDWYNSERKLALQAKANKLIREAGDSKSTAAAQALGTILKQLNEQEQANDNNKLIVYNFIPLNENEIKNGSINVNETIPSSIRDAIEVIDESN